MKDMDVPTEQPGASSPPCYRIFACGPFLVKRWDGISYQAVPVGAWGGSHYPRLLLKVLLCSPGRQASRGRLQEILWPDADPEEASRYLNDAAYRLRKVLQPTKEQESLLLTAKDASTYALAGQERLWMDADAALALVEHMELVERRSGDAGGLLEEAVGYLSRGEFLEDEGHLSFYGRRATVARARRGCLLSLARAYGQRGWLRRAEALLSGLLEENPLDEDAVRTLMLNLHKQERTSEALRLYEETRGLLEHEGLSTTAETQALAHRLRSEEITWAPMHRHLLFQQEEIDGSVTYPRIWNVPYQRNPFFTGREDVLTRLHEMLNREKAVVSIAQHALCGLGGIGKTQTVLEYIYRYESEYQAMFWIKADTRENLFADFLSLAQLLALPEREAQDQGVVTAAIQRWLQEYAGWLLVFDNADDLEMVREVLPTGCQGHVLLTTRAQAMGRVAHRLEVEEMSLEIGALFLLRRAGLIEPDAPLEKASEKDRVLAEGLVQELGGLPLALDQAGAYVEETASSLQEYLALYNTHRLALLQRRGGLTTDHPESVATTWVLAFTHIENSDPVAASLLRLCAFLDPDAIPEEILFAGLQHLAVSSSEIHQLRFNEAIGSLLRFSLVRRNGDTHTITVHRLIQSVVRDNLLPERRSEWIHRVAHLLSEAFPPAVEVTSWPLCEKLLPHALLCAQWIERAHITSMEAASLLNTIGYYLNMRARYEIAKPLFQRALSIRELVLGEQHPDTAQTLSDLAYLYHHQDMFEEATHFLQRSLSIRQQVLGMEHPDTATSLNALALLYRDQGRYEEAEPFFQQALAIRKQIFGAEHQQTAHSLSNLAWLYRNLGKYAEAEPLYEQSLTIRKRILGVDHPDTATSLNGLALLYAAQKEYTKAEPLFQQAVTIRQQVLGTKHLHTTQSMNALALLYRDQGEYEKAERLFLEVLAIREQLLGGNHPRTVTSLHNLALLYHNQGKCEQAEPLFQRALTLREQLFGREHPLALAILNNLTLCQKKMKE